MSNAENLQPLSPMRDCPAQQHSRHAGKSSWFGDDDVASNQLDERWMIAPRITQRRRITELPIIGGWARMPVAGWIVQPAMTVQRSMPAVLESVASSRSVTMDHSILQLCCDIFGGGGREMTELPWRIRLTTRMCLVDFVSTTLALTTAVQSKDSSILTWISE